MKRSVFLLGVALLIFVAACGSGESSSQPTQVALPLFSPNGGTFSSSTNLSISIATADAAIRYTLDGSDPSRTNGTIYSAPISITSTVAVKAIAYKDGFTESSIVSNFFAVIRSVAAPTFSIPAGTHNSNLTVALVSTTPGATIQWSTNGGSNWTTGNSATIDHCCTLTAKATKPEWNDGIATAAYTLQVIKPSFSPAPGKYTNTQSVTITCDTSGASIEWSVDGGTQWNSGATAIIDKSCTLQVRAKKAGWSVSDIASGIYTIPQVYVAGYESNGSCDVAKYWKNGASYPLGDGIHTTRAFSVYVSGTNVYVAGWAHNGTKGGATYWKNGAAVTLSPTAAGGEAKAIVVDGANVYVGGHLFNGSRNIAGYWLNGTFVPLSDGTYSEYVESICVRGTNVYVAGYQYNGSIYIAKCWVNGTAVLLSDGTQTAQAYSVTADATDVYVAGYEYNGTRYIAKYWKNGSSVPVTTGVTSAKATGVFVKNSKIYLAGFEVSGTKSLPKYWNDGSPVLLNDGSMEEYPEDIYVTGGDVYLTGFRYNGSKWLAKYWCNGTAIDLTDGTKEARAYSIFVVP